MQKSFIKRGYKPQGVAAVSRRTGHLAFLDGMKVYEIIREPYDFDFAPALLPTLKSLCIKADTTKVVRRVVDIRDWKTEEVFTVEFALGNVLNEPEHKDAGEKKKNVAGLADDFIRTIKEYYEAGSEEAKGCSVAIFIAENISDGVGRSGSAVLGNSRDLFIAISHALDDNPSLAGWIGAAAMSARFSALNLKKR